MNNPASSLASSTPMTEPLAICHVTVVPMDQEQLLPVQTVVLDGGSIRMVGPTRVIDTGALRRLDATGLFLMPGLADMHAHALQRQEAAGELGMFLANGVTFVRQMWGAPGHLAYAKQVQLGALPCPHLFPVSPIVDGLDDKGQVIHPGSAPLALLQAIGAAAAAAGLRVTGHCPNGVTYEQAIAAGMTCFEHLTGITTGHLRDSERPPRYADAMRWEAEQLDEPQIQRLAEQMAAQEIWNCPTLVVRQPGLLEPPALLTDPLLQYVPAFRQSRWEGTLRRIERGRCLVGSCTAARRDVPANPWFAPRGRGAATARDRHSQPVRLSGLLPARRTRQLRESGLEPLRRPPLRHGGGGALYR